MRIQHILFGSLFQLHWHIYVKLYKHINYDPSILSVAKELATEVTGDLKVVTVRMLWLPEVVTTTDWRKEHRPLFDTPIWYISMQNWRAHFNRGNIFT